MFVADPLLLALKAQGRREITFTGGEPLLNKPFLLKALAEIASWGEQPEVTVKRAWMNFRRYASPFARTSSSDIAFGGGGPRA